ncbi:hypothetical protein FHR81_005522 [Actinoalloteichus hoggarensis]|uniref:Uncharacterized protein n=1 Tax=Actinoalloteichus hoggarensis TaxID=1470176 RepID=A0A221W589_9PSEU|nr:hypothetical protein AHOG_15415 [Actinoalloteichus hoggarensis]MBB5924437.1 hypothetical protein [Actinoalloteichus hoggarensis]
MARRHGHHRRAYGENWRRVCARAEHLLVGAGPGNHYFGVPLPTRLLAWAHRRRTEASTPTRSSVSTGAAYSREEIETALAGLTTRTSRFLRPAGAADGGSEQHRQRGSRQTAGVSTDVRRSVRRNPPDRRREPRHDDRPSCSFRRQHKTPRSHAEGKHTTSIPPAAVVHTSTIPDHEPAAVFSTEAGAVRGPVIARRRRRHVRCATPCRRCRRPPRAAPRRPSPGIVHTGQARAPSQRVRPSRTAPSTNAESDPCLSWAAPLFPCAMLDHLDGVPVASIRTNGCGVSQRRARTTVGDGGDHPAENDADREQAPGHVIPASAIPRCEHVDRRHTTTLSTSADGSALPTVRGRHGIARTKPRLGHPPGRDRPIPTDEPATAARRPPASAAIDAGRPAQSPPAHRRPRLPALHCRPRRRSSTAASAGPPPRAALP